MRFASLAACLALMPLVAVPAHANDAERYRLEKSANGYVRMDTQTGAMSICEEKEGQLVCRVAADDSPLAIMRLPLVPHPAAGAGQGIDETAFDGEEVTA